MWMSQFQTITQAERRAVEGEAEAEARKITANLVPAVSAELHVHRDGQDRRQRLAPGPRSSGFSREDMRGGRYCKSSKAGDGARASEPEKAFDTSLSLLITGI